MVWNFHYDLQHIVIFLDRKCKKGSPRPYDLQCFRNAISHTCFFIPSTMNTWYFEKQKWRSKSVAFHNVCGALFGKKCKKGSPRPYELQCFRNAIFGSRFFDLVTMNTCYFEKQKWRSKSVAFYNVWGALFGKKFKKASIWAGNINVFEKRFPEVVFLTWSQWFFTFSKVKNSVPDPWRNKAQIGLRGAKSPKKHPSELGI